VAPYSKDALGEEVRGLRERQGWTQEQLGREAGYRTGAGVSISRLEGGLLTPSPERFAGIAAALGLTVDELETLASSRMRSGDRASGPGSAERGGEAGATMRGPKAPPGQKELNARRKRIEDETGARTRTITELSDAFNAAHDRARDEFYLRLVAVAGRVQGARAPDPTALADDGAAAAGGAAGGRRSADAGAAPSNAGRRSSAASYALAVADGAVAGATAGGAGTKVGGDAVGRVGIKRAASGTLVLAGIVAVPVGILFAGGLAYMVKRNRTQRQEFAAQLDEAEAQLAATRPGIAALEDILPRAVATFDYISTHAGHAVERWEEQHASEPTTWDALSPAGQRRYLELLEIAEAQAAIANVDFQGLLITRDRDQEHLIEAAVQVLTESRDVVRARV